MDTLRVHFTLEASTSSEGSLSRLQWVLATPKDKESPIKSVRIGFDGQALAALDIVDSFGQRSLIRFSNMQTNVRLPTDAFTFSPPAGADLLQP